MKKILVGLIILIFVIGCAPTVTDEELSEDLGKLSDAELG